MLVDYIKCFLYKLEPELAHNLVIKALSSDLYPSVRYVSYPRLETKVMDIHFRNPIGLAAGFDKNAQCIPALWRQGFGFVETGTVTPLKQTGNPIPRVFRLPKNKAIINRLGFNSLGKDNYLKGLRKHTNKAIIGSNIGKNKESRHAIDDYVTMLDAVYKYCNYITVNISSPNTAGLRDLQKRELLDALLDSLVNKRSELLHSTDIYRPIVIKISPDNTAEDYQDIVAMLLKYKIDAVMVSNTSIARDLALIKEDNISESGGLSGQPLKDIATNLIRDVYRISSGKLPIIGVGGISNAQDVYDKLKAGASLVQIYTALIYHGFTLVNDILRDLDQLLSRDGFNNIQQVVGLDHVK